MMKRYKNSGCIRCISIIFSIFSLTNGVAANSEKQRSITLDEAICLARSQSVDAAVALNELKTAYWEFRTFRADLLPEVNLAAVVPSYTKS